jgi:hypothetical protein
MSGKDRKKEEGKVYRVFINENMGFSEATSSLTIRTTVAATGSLAQYEQYYNETSAAVERAAHAGSLSPSEVSSVRQTLEKWRELSQGYYQQIQNLSKDEKPAEIAEVKKKIDSEIPMQQKLLEEVHERIVGTEGWKKVTSIFEVKSSSKKDTAFFKDKSHSDLIYWLLKWIEQNDKEKMLANIIHGPSENGVDISVFQAISGVKPKFGIQLKNNKDILEKDFARDIKAQITDAKKHQLQGLIVFLSGNMMDSTVEKKVSNILAEISEMKDPSLIAISPERAMTIISSVAGK